MSIATEKTEVMVLLHYGKQPTNDAVVKYEGKIFKLTKSKKVLRIVIDSNLTTFKEHKQIQDMLH